MAFATKAGSTEQVATAIAEALRKSGNTADLRRAPDVREPVSGWGCLVFGAPIYSARWHRDAHRFLRRHRGELEHVPVRYAPFLEEPKRFAQVLTAFLQQEAERCEPRAGGSLRLRSLGT